VPVGETQHGQIHYLNGVPLQAAGPRYRSGLKSEDFESADDIAEQAKDKKSIYRCSCLVVTPLEPTEQLGLEHSRGLKTLLSD
jgi:hypothetical protein